MANNPESPLDLLWKEYSLVFKDFDDLTLARWLAQTLSQLEEKAWRLSHPLLGAYRLASQAGQERHIWLKRLANPPQAYAESPCCRSPMLPLLTRDVKDAGLICQHCNDTLVPFDEIPAEARPELETWANDYGVVHAVAHWDDRQRRPRAITIMPMKRRPRMRRNSFAARAKSSRSSCWSSILRSFGKIRMNASRSARRTCVFELVLW